MIKMLQESYITLIIELWELWYGRQLHVSSPLCSLLEGVQSICEIGRFWIDIQTTIIQNLLLELCSLCFSS